MTRPALTVRSLDHLRLLALGYTNGDEAAAERLVLRYLQGHADALVIKAGL